MRIRIGLLAVIIGAAVVGLPVLVIGQNTDLQPTPDPSVLQPSPSDAPIGEFAPPPGAVWEGGSPEMGMSGRCVMVPRMVMEEREVVCTEMRPKKYMQKYACQKRVPYTKMVCRTAVRLATHKCPEIVCRQEPAPQDSHHTVQVAKMVPKTEKCVKMRKVTRLVPCEERHLVCEDQGCWEPCECTCSCHKCRSGGCCGKCQKRRWVPNIVEVEKCVTVMKKQTFEEEVECEVTRMVPELQDVKLTFREHGHVKKITEERMVELLVPECVQEQIPVTEYHCYTEYVDKACIRMEPTKIIKTVLVPVCRMVPVAVP